MHEFRKSVISLLIAVYCCQYYFALSSEKPLFFTQYFTKLLITCFSARIYILHIYRVLDLLSPISLSLSPRQFVCRYNSTSFRLLSYIVIKLPLSCPKRFLFRIPLGYRAVQLNLELNPRDLVAGPACWWAQVDSNYRPRAYQARALTN